jgi:exosortase
MTFVLAAALFLLLERFSSLRRSLLAPIRNRWLTNFGLMLAGALAASVFFTDSIITVAAALPNGFVSGLGMPLLVEAGLLFLFLDHWHYWQHRVFHEVPLLWRVHRVHHSDTAVDISTSVRHHPFETMIATLVPFLLLFALGFSVQAFGLYLLVVTASSILTHANISLPESLDRRLRSCVVTPDVHAIHHSSEPIETNSNYGAVLTIWDRLFGTYRAPAGGPARLGLEYFRREQDASLLSALIQPFQNSGLGRWSEESDLPTHETQDRGSSLRVPWRKTLLYSGLGSIVTLLIYWPTVLHLTRLWTETESYRYAWLVVPMFVYIVAWYRRDSILSMTPSASYFGLPLILAAFVLWLMCFSADIMLGQHLALVLTLQGVALCALGKETYLKLLPIMWLLFLMIPCGDVFQAPLRDLTLNWLGWFATLTNLPHSIDGYHIVIAEQKYVVLGACSGLSLFTLAGFLGYSIGLLLFRSTGKVFALAALGGVLGVLTNAIRVCLIVAIDWINGTQMDLLDHKDIQWLLLAFLVGGLLYLSTRFKHEDWPNPMQQSVS